MHTSFHKGTPIFIKFKDGTTTVGKFADHKSGKVLLEDGRTINLETVRTMTIRKLEATVSKPSKRIKYRIER